MKKLIVEVWKNTGMKAIDVTDTPEGMLMIEGVIGRVDSLNRNKRFYPKGEYARHIDLLQERIAESNGILGEMEHPKSMNINLNNVSHKIVEARVDEDGFVRGKVLLLDTPKGKIAQSVVRSGSPLPISSRAVGQVSESGEVKLDFLSTYDLVGTSGFAEASMGPISESLDTESGKVVMETYEYDIDDNGDAVSASTLQGIVEAVEARLEKKYADAIGSTSIDENKLNELVENKLSTLAPKISQFISESKDEDEEVKEAVQLSESDIIELMNKQFVKVHAPIIESWVRTEALPENAEITEKWLNQVLDKRSELIESWLRTEVLPENAEVTEKWIQSVLENNADVTQNWILTEFVSEHSEVLEKWITAKIEENAIDPSDLPVYKNKEAEAKKAEDEAKDSDKTEKALSKEAQEVKESKDVADLPVYKDKKDESEKVTLKSKILETLDAKILEAKAAKKEEEDEKEDDKDVNESKQVDETHYHNAPVWLANIPNEFKYIWESLNQDQRSQVYRKASVRMFETHDSITKFWNSLNINEMLKTSASTYKREAAPINENLNGKRSFVNFAKSIK